MHIRSIAMILLLSGVALPVNADMFEPSHSCHEPYKPYEFTSQWELDQYQSDVENYQRCINDFVEEQEQAIRKHQSAAEDAVDDWNRYVNLNLR